MKNTSKQKKEEHKHCWQPEYGKFTDHSDCEKCCGCGVSYQKIWADKNLPKEEYKTPCKKKCLEHKYHCMKCNTAVSFSPANYCSRQFDIPNQCNFCNKPSDFTTKKDWEETFSKMYDDNENGGSSRWYVSPTSVKTFIKGIILQAQEAQKEQTRKEIVEILKSKQKDTFKTPCEEWYNASLQDIIELLKVL